MRAAEGGEEGTHTTERRWEGDIHEPVRVRLHGLAEELVAGEVGIRKVKLHLRENLPPGVVVQGLECTHGARGDVERHWCLRKEGVRRRER